MPSLSTLSPDTGLLPTPSPELGYSHPHPYPVHRSVSQTSSAASATSDLFLRPSAAGTGQSAHAGLPSWEVLRPEEVSLGSIGTAAAGVKRGHESVEDFFTDMKKRRVNPSYDPRQWFIPPPFLGADALILTYPLPFLHLDMAERLSSLAHAQQQFPSSVSHGTHQ